MGCLVFIHKIHVNSVIGDFPVKLSVEVEQRFPEFLESQYPGFCRREGVHPGDHSRTGVVHVGFVERLPDQLIGDECRFPHKFVREIARCVQHLHHFPGMLSYMSQAFISV